MHLKHFDESEFDCPCCDANNMELRVMSALDHARSIAGVPFTITSGYRCPSHNRSVGGSETSSHLGGTAADIYVLGGHQRYLILTALLEAGFTRLGVDGNFIHADMDDSKDQRVLWTY